MTRWLAGSLAALALIALAVVFSPEAEGIVLTGFFTDDDGHLFESDIDAIAAADITRGCNPPANDRYCPEDDVTRGEMAAFLRRALGLPRASTDFFTDDNSSIFEEDINAIAAAGITRGCNPPANDRYCPDDDVDRGQMAAFLRRALNLPSETTDFFTDDDRSTFEGDINAIADDGITRGCNPPSNTKPKSRRQPGRDGGISAPGQQPAHGGATDPGRTPRGDALFEGWREVLSDRRRLGGEAVRGERGGVPGRTRHRRRTVDVQRGEHIVHPHPRRHVTRSGRDTETIRRECHVAQLASQLDVL